MPQTVPNRPTKGAGRRHGGEHEQLGFELLDLARDGDVEHLLDARLQAHEGGAGARLEGAFPFAHRGDEQRRHAGLRPLGELAVELLERMAGPEDFLEAVHRAAHAREKQRLVDDDRPAPDRGGEQADHDDLDDDMRAPEHAPDRDVGGGSGERARGDLGWIYDLSLSRQAFCGGFGCDARSIARNFAICGAAMRRTTNHRAGALTSRKA